MIELLRVLEKLNSPRRGWLKRGVPEPVENISEHMYQMAVVLMAYPWVRRPWSLGSIQAYRLARMMKLSE
jgi:5'-deoxynucleotidase YfbR-like HD superfamily hydrolase